MTARWQLQVVQYVQTNFVEARYRIVVDSRFDRVPVGPILTVQVICFWLPTLCS